MSNRRQRKMPRKSYCGQFHMFAIFSLFFTFIFFILHGFYDLYHYDNYHKLEQTYKSDDPSLSVYNTSSIYKKYCPCSSTNPLTYIKNEGGKTLLRIGKIVESHYAPEGITCCYSNVTLRNGATFGPIGISECEFFQDEVELESHVVIVKCTDNATKMEVYSNAHVVTYLHKHPISAHHFAKRSLSVLIMNIGDVSSTTIGPMYPQTNHFMKTNNWIGYEAYRHINPDARVNIMAMLTGSKLKSAHRNFFDEDSIWNDFKNNDYTLGYMDKINVNFLDNRYLRSYIVACEILRFSNDGACSNSSNAEIIFNLIKIFVRKRPFFGMFWMDEKSAGDLDIIRFLEYMRNERVTDNTITVLFGGTTKNEKTESSLLYFGLPNWFGLDFSKEYEYLKANSLRGATPYDMYMTLQDILVLSGCNLTLKHSKTCPPCRSLFKRRLISTHVKVTEDIFNEV